MRGILLLARRTLYLHRKRHLRSQISRERLFLTFPSVCRRKIVIYFLIFLCFGSGVTGCTTPAQRYDEHALTLGFEAELIETSSFKHRIYFNRVGVQDIVHVYFDGDGTPWEQRRWVASDPTARNPLILDMMKLDKAPAILLGRPCYHGVDGDTRCHPRYWTSHRYAEEVVDSMVQALTLWLADKNVRQIVLIGYSGGGTLGMLVAPRIERVALIVTIAANLDVAGWNAYHGYSPFKDSLDPSDDIESVRQIDQIHIAGGEDDIVPATLVRTFAAHLTKAQFIEYEEFDHRCCWLDIWSHLLTEIRMERSL